MDFYFVSDFCLVTAGIRYVYFKDGHVNELDKWLNYQLINPEIVSSKYKFENVSDTYYQNTLDGFKLLKKYSDKLNYGKS